MRQDLQENVNAYKKENRKSSVWRRIVLGLACCVVFCTTYALILPAITMKQETFCGKEEHTHTQDCYVQDTMAAVLICPLEEGMYVLADGTVVSELPAVEATEVPAVEVTEAPVVEVTETPATETTEAPVTEVTEAPEAEVTEAPVVETPAVETTEAPAAEATEVPGTAAPEPTTVPTAVPEATPVPTPHVHTAECYAQPEENALTCTLEEGEGHTHNFLCYGSWKLVCVKDEHTHSLICFSNPDADVENAVVWEQMMNSLPLTGDWSQDIITISKNQLGYVESSLNYQVGEGGALCGYTRYGAWNGTPYTEWNTLFVNFCISYAGVEGMPFYEDCPTWINELTAADLFHVAANGIPESGNLLFLDGDGDSVADQVGIITEISAATEETPAQIKIIGGNIDNQVQYATYESGDTRIVGYGCLPKQPVPTYQYVDSKVKVEVQLPEGTGVPRNAQLMVKTIGPESAEYASLLAQAEETVEGNIAQIQFYDICFYSKQNEYIPFEDWAQVTMNFGEGVVEAVEEMVVLHYDEKESTPVVLEDVSVVGEAVADTSSYVVYSNAEEVTGTVVSFETNGFSTFAVVGVQTEQRPDMYEMTITSAPTGTATLESSKTFMIYTAFDVIDNTLDEGKDTRIALSSELVTVHENGSASQQLKGVEVTCENNKVLAPADNRLLWEIIPTGDGRTIYIKSVATGQYLYINGANWSLSNEPRACRTEAKFENDNSNRVIFNDSTGFLAFYDLSERPNEEGIPCFKASWDASDSRIRVLLTEYSNEAYVTDSTEYVTNLDGQILAVIAVNNLDVDGQESQNIVYPALASTSNNTGELIGSDVYNVSVENESLIIGEENDNSNRIAWKFTDADKAGSYYMQAANFYGTPNADNTAGKYLNITSEGISVSDTKQAIEVVEATIYDSCLVKNNVVCLRAKVDDIYYTVQLNNNRGAWDFVSSGTVQDNPNTANYRGNHFVLASLADQPDLDFMDWIDEIPATEDFDATVDAITGADAVETFALQTAERERLRQLAMKAAAYYFGTTEYTSESVTALKDVQRNFIGKDRIEKFLALEWLWRRDPNVVQAADPDVVVKLFNYTEQVNTYYFDNDPAKKFGFYSYDANEKTVDDGRTPGNGESWAPVMSPVLGPNGYPVITRIPVQREVTNPETQETTTITEWVDVNNGELDYLFNGQFQEASMQNGGGLFQKDARGYYYYFSDMNAAWYDPNAKEFVLYDVVVRPEYTRLKYQSQDGDTNDSRSNFLPFDEVVGNIIYDDEALFGPDGENFGDDPDTVKTRYDNYGTIETQTAYLNDPTNLWFGMTLDYNFFIPTDATIVNEINGQEVKEDMIFEFHGDDDVFVYIDNMLILNIGGAHAARSGSINFKTGAVSYQTDLDSDGDGIPEDGASEVNTNLRELFRTAMAAQSPNGVADEEQLEILFDGNTLADNTMHNLKFFYVERGGTYSYAGIKFNMPTIPENSLMVGKELTNDENVIDAGQVYSFRIVNADNPNEVYVGNANYILYENGEMVGSGTVGADGIFTLKANQQALFAGVLDTNQDDKRFIVQELIPTNVDGQYQVFYRDDVNSNMLVLNSTTENGMKIYPSTIYSVDGINGTYTKNVVFTNEVVDENLDTLKITKEAGEGTQISDSEEFDIQVQVAADRNSVLSPIPVGTKYTVNGEERSVATEGIIPLKVNETAVITGFLSGTYWTVQEENVTGYSPEYRGVAEKGVIEPSGYAGTFGLADTVEFTITNHSGANLINIPISKQAEGNDTSHTFDFVAELGTWDWNGNWTKYRDLNIGKITVTDDTETLGSIPVNLKATDTGNNVYIKVYERKDGGSYIYDETFYLVEYTISEVNGETEIRVNGSQIFRNDGNYNGSDGYVVWPNPIPFINQKINGFTVSKEVVNIYGPVDPEEEFSFEATITENGAPYTAIPDPGDDSYTVDAVNGKVYFELKHDESLTIPVPEGVTITVTETTTTGYTTSHQITQGAQEPGAIVGGATTGEIVMGAEGAKVHFINRTGYELPKTGGRGTMPYRLGGLLLMVVSIGLGIFRMRRKSSRNT